MRRSSPNYELRSALVPRPANASLPQVDVSDITLAGEQGYELCREIAHVSARRKPIEVDGLSRRSDGALQLRVTPETIQLLSGRAKLR